ncbi:TPA: helix-turn-helix transcriptional regulator [Enterobacter ludwigii]|nr:helix-turn-helix transcriptional regulator [Enterobacter ludwigii]
MDLSEFVISENWFFKFGINLLLTKELIDSYYYIVDLDTVNYKDIRNYPVTERKTIAFVSNDIDYYTVKKKNEDIHFLDKRICINKIMKDFFSSQFTSSYIADHKLSSREIDVLSCLREGLSPSEVVSELGIKEKTFYTYRRYIMLKLKLNNRLFFYKNLRK